jgi:type I restriction enzyme R subunit
VTDATNALYTTDEAQRHFEIMAREVFNRFKALIAEPSVYAFVARHDNIEAIYTRLESAAIRPTSPGC